MAPTASSPDAMAEFAVIGSGPGGSLTAALLAEAGRDVLLLEEGPFLDLESCPAFSREEMVTKYRNGGLSVAMGRTKVAFVEGRCVGGGSEVNSGLYHRPPAEVLAEWRRSHAVEACTEADLLPHCQANEADLSVSHMPGGLPRASLMLHEGASRLGWRSLEVPRWFAYDPDQSGRGSKQSMTKTFVPRFLKAGGRILPHVKVHKLQRRSGTWQIVGRDAASNARGTMHRLEVKNIVLAAGAIQTPLLLQRSGLGQHAGRTLHMHPTVKVTARFPEPVNSSDMGVPVHQVKEFSPRLSFGCSISSPPYLALAMLDHPRAAADVSSLWPRMAIYYAMSRGGQGSVRALPWFQDPLVRYQLNSADMIELGDGMQKLCQCLFAAGAEMLYPSINGGPHLTNEGQLHLLPEELPPGRTGVMTIHLFSSCPMGENRNVATADSFGRVHGCRNLWIADGSLLPGPPGVNPQGTIMALARRNAHHLLGKL